MSEMRRRLALALVLVLVVKVQREAAAMKAQSLFEDMGSDDCEVCRQARLRQAFQA